jgi:zinc transport system ATP-binding protein
LPPSFRKLYISPIAQEDILSPLAIEIQNLDFAYSNQPVLSGVNLSIEQGDFVAFLGPNGGGKSTLLKLCLGLLTPQKGTIKILGQEIRHGHNPALARIGYVPQNFEGSIGFPVSVEDLVLTGRLSPGRYAWFWSKEDRAATREALELVGLWHRRAWRLDRLSGGQRQRVMIARALSSNPEIIFLDEPVASVDQQWQARLFELFKDLNREATIVLVSHDMTAISSHVKSVTCVNEQVHYHPQPQITPQMLSEAYKCPVELIAHGVPHRVLARHDSCGDDHA